MRITRRSLHRLVGTGALGIATPAIAQTAARFPDRPIRMINPWPPGGATDAQMRLLCDIAARHLGQPVVVENRTGASGTMGAMALASDTRSDGYLLSQMGLAVFRNPLMSPRPLYDPTKDFTWIIHLTGYLAGVAVRADAPWKTMGELMADIRANPGKLAYGSPGAGSASHLTMEEIRLKEGVEWLHVPFRGGPDNLQALLGGQTQFCVESSAWAPLVEAGQLRLLAVFTDTRAKRFPDVPTLKESGIDVNGNQPYGLAGPRNMDPGVTRVLHDAFKLALYDPQHVAILDRYDMPLIYADSGTYTEMARRQYESDKVLIQRLGLAPS